uniref:Uncharacterized protein n=1 Tax=Rhizophora mucronata TaxID=61149 RepID=A0A2P2PY73_RHIMU
MFEFILVIYFVDPWTHVRSTKSTSLILLGMPKFKQNSISLSKYS